MLHLCHNYFNVYPNNKSSKDCNRPQSKRRYLFGILILLLVNILWVVSSELTKYIYKDINLERPFLITYVRSSLLLIYLVALCFSPPTKDPCQPADYTQLLEPTAETDDENYFNDATNSLGDSTFVPVRAGETTDSDDAAPRAVRFNKVAEVRVMSAAQAGEALLARLSWAASVRATEYAQRRAAAAATRRHLRLALMFSLPWFVSNYLYRLSLLHTTTSVATIYTSTTCAFTLSFGAIFAQVPSDRFTVIKAVAVLLSSGGLVILGALDKHHGDWVAVLSALGAALCYAVHLMLFRRELRKPEGINKPLLTGLVGCACAALGWAGCAALSASGAEKADLPAPRAALWVLLDAALHPLATHALHLWGCSLTSTRVATCSLCACIALPLALDGARGRLAAAQLAAAILAAAGWLLAAADQEQANALIAKIARAIRTPRGFSAIRNIPDLDEQSEALMSSDEPT